MRRRRRRLLFWALCGVGLVWLWRLLRAPPAAPAPTMGAAADRPSTATVGRGTGPRPRGSRESASPVLPIAVGLALLVVGTSAALGIRHDNRVEDGTTRARDLPAPVAGALGVGEPMDLAAAAVWAPVRYRTQVTSSPSRRAPIIARLSGRTPEGTQNLVSVLDAAMSDEDRTLWVRVRLAGTSGDVVGWVQRATLGGYTAVEARVVVDRARRTLTLFRRGEVALRVPVGVGTASNPTPSGEFYIRNKLTRYRSPFYGPVAFGTSAQSATLTDWPAGGFIGIHGTNRPDLIPGAVSHGCIRVRNADIVRLARTLAVGTPVTIR